MALGLVLVHRTSGVVNLAAGAIAMYSVFVYSECREVGDLIFPVIGLPPRIHLTDTPTVGLALVVALGSATGLGLLCYLIVFSWLRGAPPLAGLVASVGVLLYLQAVALLQFGAPQRPVAPVLPVHAVHVLGVQVPSDRLVLTAVVLAVAAGLALLSRGTRLGLAGRAAAEDEESLALLGWSPTWVAAGAWTLSGLLAGLFGILVAPITAVDPTNTALLVVPALAAALVGALSSFLGAAAAGLALGVVQALLLPLQRDVPALNQPGLRDALPLLVIIAVAVLRGRLVPDRTTAAAGRLPLSRPASPWLLAAVPAAVAGLFLLPSAERYGLIVSLAGVLICLSFVVLTGYGGTVSLAQLALAGVGGFSLARLHTSLHVPFPIAPLLAAALAAVVGVLLGLASRRVRGVDLAVLTLAAGVAVQEAVFKSPALTSGNVGATVPPPKAGIDFGIGAGSAFPRPVFGLLVLVVVAAAAVGVDRLRRGRRGLQLIALRGDERAAAAAGVPVARTRLAAFGAAAGLAGLAGALLGYSQGQLSVQTFSVSQSLVFLAVAYAGGIAGVPGALVGGLLVPSGLLSVALGVGRYELLVASYALVAVVLLRPEGITGVRRPGRSRRRDRPA